MSEKYLVKGFDTPKQSKNGNSYCMLTLESINTGDATTFKALYFFNREFDLKLGEKYELDVKDGSQPNQKIANKPKPKKNWSGGGNRGISFNEHKRLKAMELVVNLIIANKVEMKNLEKVKKRLEEII